MDINSQTHLHLFPAETLPFILHIWISGVLPLIDFVLPFRSLNPRCSQTARTPSMASRPLPTQNLGKLARRGDDSDSTSASKFTRKRALLQRQKMPPMRISTRSPLRSEPGIGAPMWRIGWQMRGLCRTGKLVGLLRHLELQEERESLMFHGVASSMIAVGLSWRMAIGACVLGNFLMGLVITTNGRIGAIVSFSLRDRCCSSTDLFTAAHPIPRSRSHALWLLLQLLCCAVPLCPCHCLAWVSALLPF